jgi:hypothetical protein
VPVIVEDGASAVFNDELWVSIGRRLPRTYKKLEWCVEARGNNSSKCVKVAPYIGKNFAALPGRTTRQIIWSP